MNFQVYPTKIEIYCDNTPAATIEAQDDAAASVKIDYWLNASEWPALSNAILDALMLLRLTGDQE